MNEEEKLTKADDEEAEKQQAKEKTEAVADEGEFKLTVRKLEVPVRPRGVLADG